LLSIKILIHVTNQRIIVNISFITDDRRLKSLTNFILLAEENTLKPILPHQMIHNFKVFCGSL